MGELSYENRALLVRKVRRPVLDPSARVTLTVGALGKLLDAARKEGRAERQPDQEATNLVATINAFFNGGRK